MHAPHDATDHRPDPASAPKILIAGAGPTGLGAGYRLDELGAGFRILEPNPSVGGLSRSFTDDAGFTWDIGGHVLFSHYAYYDKVFDHMMGEDFTLNDRESWVRMCGTWVPYPFQNNIRYLPAEVAYECISGLIQAQTTRSHADATNFGEFIDAVFGDGIAKWFMRPYNFKVWAHPPELMNKQWIGERVAVVDFDRALKNLLLQKDDYGWGPNNRFKFPLRGGTGDFYRRLGEHLDQYITTGVGIECIDSAARTATLTDGTTERYDDLISTMPLDILVTRIIKDAPESIRDAASRLRHSGGLMVGVGIKRPCPSTRSWMYFPESDCPFYRVTYLSNYSPNMTPDRETHYSLLCETSFSEFKPEDESTIVERTIAGLEACGLLEPGERDDIVSTWLYRADYAYPTPSVERDEVLAEVIPWLESRGIHSRGRFGMWKYEVANTDHSVMQGVECVNRILLGEAEQTIGLTYNVTEDGRNAAIHERPGVAGSGEKRIKPDVVVRTKAPPAGDIDEAEVGEEELGVTPQRGA